MMREVNECPNCNQPLKAGLFKSSYLISETKTRLINEILEKNANGYCNKCGGQLFRKAKQVLLSETKKCEQIFKEHLDAIPMASIYHPYNWEYATIGIVTGQSVTGTGVFAEMFSDVTDFLGAQSKTYSTKLAKGEKLCFAQLRYKTLQQGGNCILGVDIDYSQAGALKGMLMVCATGTSAKLHNTEVLGERAETLNLLTQTTEKHEKLRRLRQAFEEEQI